ncbi:MAG: Arm DNA-binding domain-containing protein, partial [Xanthobacteraceae bacterium]
MRKFPRVSPESTSRAPDLGPATGEEPKRGSTARGKRSRRVAITDRSIRALKATSGRVEVGDAKCRGLSIRCTATGVKTWTFAYKLNGKMRRITLGEFPDLGLSDA